MIPLALTVSILGLIIRVILVIYILKYGPNVLQLVLKGKEVHPYFYLTLALFFSIELILTITVLESSLIWVISSLIMIAASLYFHTE